MQYINIDANISAICTLRFTQLIQAEENFRDKLAYVLSSLIKHIFMSIWDYAPMDMGGCVI